jgi:hypothetical protein
MQSGMEQAKKMTAGICPAVAERWSDMELCANQARSLMDPSSIKDLPSLFKGMGVNTFGLQPAEFLPPEMASQLSTATSLMDMFGTIAQVTGGGQGVVPGGIPGGIPSFPNTGGVVPSNVGQPNIFPSPFG